MSSNEYTNYPLIILEGCDAAGKSTLASHLRNDAGYTVIHSAYNPSADALIKHYESIMRNPDKLVMDRSFVSEVVYGEILRGKSRINDSQFRHLVELVADEHGCFVHVRASLQTIIARLQDRQHENDPNLSHIEAILTRYDEVFGVIGRHATVFTHATDAP